MKLRFTTFFGDVFVLDNPDLIDADGYLGPALRGPYWWEQNGQEYVSGLFYIDTAKSIEPVAESGRGGGRSRWARARWA